MKKAAVGCAWMLAAVLFAVPIASPRQGVAWAGGQAAAGSENDSQIQADIEKQLGKSRFKDVHASVQNGVLTLNGTVSVYADKEEIDHKAHRVKNTVAVRNLVEIGGAEISDQDLQQKLVQKIQYDRVGYGTTPFNAISVGVQNGVVTLGGHAYGPVDKDSALSAAANTPGVKDVIDEIEVDPVSPMDDRLRINLYRAIYGFPSLNKYAIDPGKSIRISVQNGHVTLYGAVDSEADKNVAAIRANGVSGVFSVNNELQVVGQPTEKKKSKK